MQKLIMLAGPSGSGKSTYADELRIESTIWNTPMQVISSDTIRKQLYGDEGDQTDHQRVFDEAHYQIEQFLGEEFSVIFDATNLVPRFRAEPINVALKRNVPVELHYMTTIAQTCIERVDKRERKVPPNVIVRQVSQRIQDFKRPLEDFFYEGFTTVQFVK